jgi:hypothetical protein
MPTYFKIFIETTVITIEGGGDDDYYRRRYYEEIIAARLAASAEARASHLKLADFYQSKISALTGEQPQTGRF